MAQLADSAIDGDKGTNKVGGPLASGVVQDKAVIGLVQMR